MQIPVKIKKLKENAIIPTKGSLQAAGGDLYACLDQAITIMPGETINIPLGFSTEFSDEYAALIYARSGLSCRQGLAPADKVGVIDSDYRGEWVVAIHNHSGNPQIISSNERVAQVVFQPIAHPVFTEVEELTETERGERGFGSTGRH